MFKKHILITSIGSLSAPFVVNVLSSSYNIIGVDIYPKSWISCSNRVNVFYQVPKTDSNNYKEVILDICKKNNIDVIIPLTDFDVDFYTINKVLFEKNNIIVTVNDIELNSVFRDKYKLSHALKKTDIDFIPSYTYNEFLKLKVSYPIITKPKIGRSSQGLFYLSNEKDLSASLCDDIDRIFQPYIEGQVVTVDVISNGIQHYFIPRIELTRTKNGAGITVETFHDDRLTLIIDEFCDFFNFLGVINIEFILTKNSFVLMDVNPRFSAGIAFSQIAGYNFILNHLNIFLEKEIDILSNYETKIMTKEYKEIIV